MYPIGGDADFKYVAIEFHYDNPDQVLGILKVYWLQSSN
jgi:hypothetical protein